ncbi:glutaminyl-peptide cyclotransferase [Pustulibacterium marinum]|uniref:glutaminyl-peptide cyclotransferase n=1 Tax=Pustulibacterium marinum TaxID=1224947 RepID=UPI001FE7E0A7|nr:glutaminyl-peptide cyclotransferase [Pustulibacterium marinum]
MNDTLKFNLKNADGRSTSQISYYIGETKVPEENGQIILKDIPLGSQNFRAVINSEDKTESLSQNIKIYADEAPTIYNVKILKEYPHDIEAYTQGLEFYKDTLYESTGLRGKSSLRKTDYKTGEVLQKIDLDPTYFGEGITILNDKIYMLTWQSMLGFVYDVNSFEKLKDFRFEESKEGWGLCNNGKTLFKSDGSEKIWTLNTETLEENSNFQLVTNKAIYSKANELEYVDGLIYANSYTHDGIMIIDPTSGAIKGVVDCRGLKEKVTQHNKLDVLNGIAYNPKTKTFFITGKNWDKMFEVTFEPK